ncbi:hypothetical protein IEO21_04207 [Rhodonia placenta]|uniref:Uncharacterized protein n=1 Tax=Rhodonia placenta TaxID=104341 RepID=A0A8H7P4B1_9APHY|nr:hypothetical protein IEO21_04207 [Postia placenta]
MAQPTDGCVRSIKAGCSFERLAVCSYESAGRVLPFESTGGIMIHPDRIPRIQHPEARHKVSKVQTKRKPIETTDSYPPLTELQFGTDAIRIGYFPGNSGNWLTTSNTVWDGRAPPVDRNQPPM